MRVGPESSGAPPGPVCYGKNGYLSITDANLVLGNFYKGELMKVIFLRSLGRIKMKH
jgi:5-oxoprolinase (ATP-hydrolysing)